MMVFALNAMITSGLRRIKTSQYGAWNQMMDGKINARIVNHRNHLARPRTYDPRIFAATTGRSAFNLGRNGSQTDMQVAVLKAYLEHNQKPEIVVQISTPSPLRLLTKCMPSAQETCRIFTTTKSMRHCGRSTPDTWKSRYVPLYGYVVEDMNFSWVMGIRGFLGWSPREEFFLGFNPRPRKWTDEFQQFKSGQSEGVRWPIDPEAIQSVEGLIQLCQQRGIELILVYSPEYAEMQRSTKNRAVAFDHFHQLADRYHVPLWGL